MTWAAVPSVTLTEAVPNASTADSSSRMRSVVDEGSATSRPPLAEPLTVSRLAAATMSLSTAVNVTVPVLVVEPAAMVSVLFVLSVKSAATAGETGAADTVTVTSSLEATLNAAVTVADPPFSGIALELSSSDNVGASSSSVMVTVAEASLSDTWADGFGSLSVTVSVSSGSSTASSVTRTLTAPVDLPDGMVSVPLVAV